MVNKEMNTTAFNVNDMILDTIYQVMQKESFSMTKASRIVGGNARLKKLIEADKIKVTKLNKKWLCNATDVLRCVKLKQVKPKNQSK